MLKTLVTTTYGTIDKKNVSDRKKDAVEKLFRPRQTLHLFHWVVVKAE